MLPAAACGRRRSPGDAAACRPPLRDPAQPGFAEVAGETFVALAEGNALQTYIEDQARDIGRRLDVRIRMKTFEGVCIMVGHGIGVGIVPRTIARQHRRSTHTVAVALSDAWAQRRLCACFAGWAQLSPAMRSLLLHLGVQPQKSVKCC